MFRRNHSKTVSAVAVGGVLLDFPAALRKVAEGRRITRLEWDGGDYVCLAGGFLSLHKEGEPLDRYHALMVQDADLLATDWVVLDD